MSSLRAGILVIVWVAVSGCALDVRRERFSVPLRQNAYDNLVVGETKLDETLDELGAPDLVERENDANEDHLWWLHKDMSDLSIRFQLPLSYFGYRHNVFQYFQGDDQTNKIHLIFDEDGTLRQKDLTLPEEYQAEAGPAPPDRLHIAPRAEHSFFLSGSADFADFDDIFDGGYLLGVDINYQPVAPLIAGLGASYSRYDGQSVTTGTGTFAFEDLELFTAEVMVRLQIPFEVFGNLFDAAEVRRILLDDDPRSADGWLVFVEGGAGVTHNSNVRVTGAGGAANFFDSGTGFSSSASAGIEYGLENVSVRAGFNFRNYDAFDSGNSTLPDDASGLRALMAMLSVAVKF